MTPTSPEEIHDFVMIKSDEIFDQLREQYPELDKAIGAENFTELHDGNTPNSYRVVLLLGSLSQCLEVKTYLDLIINAHKSIDSRILESFEIIYLIPNSTGNGYSENTFFIHNFQGENK
jgi:hypothetical protein